MAVPFDETLRSLRNDTRGRAPWLTALVFGLLAAWLWSAAALPLPTTVASIQGRVVSATPPAQVSANTTEPVLRVHVQLGDRVAKGDPLIAFDAERPSLAIWRARPTGVSRLEAEIESINLEIQSKREELADRLATHDRGLDRLGARIEQTKARIEYSVAAERIYAKMRSERQIDELKYREAISALQQDRMELQALDSEVSELEANRQLAQSQWDSEFARLRREASRLDGELAEERPPIAQIERRISDLTVEAPFDGVVEALAPGITAGQVLPLNSWILTVAPEERFEFEATFLSSQAAGRISTGQSAEIEFFALPWTQFGTLDASVVRVGNEERDGNIDVAVAMDESQPLFAQVTHGLEGRVTVSVRSATLLQKLLQLIGATSRLPTS